MHIFKPLEIYTFTVTRIFEPHCSQAVHHFSKRAIVEGALEYSISVNFPPSSACFSSCRVVPMSRSSFCEARVGWSRVTVPLIYTHFGKKSITLDTNTSYLLQFVCVLDDERALHGDKVLKSCWVQCNSSKCIILSR